MLADEKRHFGWDVLRAIAVCLVLLLHANMSAIGVPPGLSHLFRFGWIGVDLFFVLSGFLISAQSASIRDRSSGSAFANLKSFWVRRWTRTLPLYYFVLFFYVVIKPHVLGFEFQDTGPKFLLFLQNFGTIGDFVQSWSLCIEEQFYFIFPLIFFFLLPRWPSIWLLALVASVVSRFICANSAFPTSDFVLTDMEFDRIFRFPFYNHLDGLSIGVFLGLTKNRWQTWSRSSKAALGLSGFVFVIAACAKFGLEPNRDHAIWFFTCLSVGFGCLLVGLSDWRTRPRYCGWITRVAILSYGAYLWNNLFIRLFDHYKVTSWPLEFSLFFLGSFAMAFATYHLVERPGMRLRSRFSHEIH